MTVRRSGDEIFPAIPSSYQEARFRAASRYPDPAERFRGEHLRDQAGTGEIMGALGEVQVDLEDLPNGQRLAVVMP